MRTVSEAGGTGTLAAIPGIDIATKTGTAEKVDPLTKRYSRDLNLSSFVGFAPADAPEVVTVVVVDEPRGHHFGGLVAGPAWRAITERALVLRGKLASGVLVAERVSGRPGPKLTDERSIPKASADTPEPDGLSTIDDPGPPPGVSGVVPDFDGLTARAAIHRAEAMGIPVQLAGSGRVVAQKPVPGSRLQAGVSIALVLADAPRTVAVLAKAEQP
jgi:cell division protein FtsI (penicillin-binding protein 3)